MTEMYTQIYFSLETSMERQYWLLDGGWSCVSLCVVGGRFSFVEDQGADLGDRQMFDLAASFRPALKVVDIQTALRAAERGMAHAVNCKTLKKIIVLITDKIKKKQIPGLQWLVK